MIRRPLIALAWLNAGVHFVALALADLAIRPGSPLVPTADRLDYLAAAPLGWTLAWACWMSCGVALIAFLAVLTSRLRERSPWAQWALMLAVMGAGFDLSCDLAYVLVFPPLAAAHLETLFLAIERIVGIGSLVLANGAYSVAILLLNLSFSGQAAKGRRERLTIMTGYLVGASGLLLATVGFTGVPWHAEWATPPTISLFCVWAVLSAYSVESTRSQS